ncbi:MAG: energy-coupling factor transporter transmembrane component T family protein, partial [Acidobacteriota bacterium]
AFVPPFLARTPVETLLYAVLLLASALPAGAWPNLRRMATIMAILFFMSAALWAILQKGATPLATLGPFTIYRESILFGVTVGLRLNCFAMAAVIFLTATRIEDFTYGLSRLGLPFAAGFALSLAFRLTPLFVETGQTIAMAQRARGLDLDRGGLLQRIRRYVPIIVPILANGLRRSDQLAIALESKGFGHSGKRTNLSDFAVSWRDFVLVAVLLAVCAAIRAGGLITGW